ncbi:helix-turn-helix domain-containing protein [Yoonia sp. SS1-5]|uniref:Helix-turn-helix domain-containing protein n=1 Tax=Yoonia rhodophyticola TaxID=3137370 RepID=A0AAN0MBR1_9RHOB
MTPHFQGSLDPSNVVDDFELMTHGGGMYLQHHRPRAMNEPYHVHPSIEINYLQGCDMIYSFGGKTVRVPQGRFCIFWAAQPHRVTDVVGAGTITNAYVSLQEFWSWPVPQDFTQALLGGGVILAADHLPGDDILAGQWAREISPDTEAMSRLHCLELQARITRVALSGWDVIAQPQQLGGRSRIGGNAIVHFERMLRFVAQRYTDPISLADVAEAASVSKNYANTLFKKILGTTVKAHVTEIRVYRARMLLAETDAKILGIALDCGFRSLSAFYEAFQSLTNMTPAQFRRQLRGE